jgi:hypothetical protein
MHVFVVALLRMHDRKSRPRRVYALLEIGESTAGMSEHGGEIQGVYEGLWV